MAEWRFFTDEVAYVSTAAFHHDRERAPHLEQPIHQGRLRAAARFILLAVNAGARTVSDLGCGDGGLLSLLTPPELGLDAWGYDFQPSNAAGWVQRGVRAQALDVFGADRDQVRLGDVAVATEVLEHLTDPHDAVRWIGGTSRWLVCSSPWDEGPGNHDECHAWAFDLDGYRGLVEQGGYRVLEHVQVDRFQIIYAAKEQNG